LDFPVSLEVFLRIFPSKSDKKLKIVYGSIYQIYYLSFFAAGFFTAGLAATFLTAGLATTFLTTGFSTTGLVTTFLSAGFSIVVSISFSALAATALTTGAFLTAFFSAAVFVFNFHTLDLGSLITLTGVFFATECVVPGFSILIFAEAENASIPVKTRCFA
jgi:hypothetical protein